MLPRRHFLGSVAAATGVSAAGLAAGATPLAPHRPGNELVRAGNVVLFQGDSITDAHRRRKNDEPNQQDPLGRGYAWLAAAGLLVHGPEKIRVYNRGISGNKVFQLADRWQRDCLDLKPDVLSILIGVNDVWHKKNGKYDGTLEKYAGDYDALLKRTKKALPKVRLVVCEPFVLRCGAIDDSWFPEFDGYRDAAKKVAERHDATFVAFQGMFDRAVKYAPPEHWAKDGVHPSSAGAALMAQTWLDAVQGQA
ncbi:MAG: SGNH/GDSL hydrolase family protein [bacterium]|nr:SGNH/GDSL hydrolase family protein [bacterium]